VGWLRIFGLGDTPKAGGGHDKFDSNLCLSHEGVAAARDPAKQFFTTGGILNANYLIDLRGGGEKYQRAVVVHNDSFRFLCHGGLAGVPESHHNWNPDLDAFAAPAILRPQV
jgi:hypothetical protein